MIRINSRVDLVMSVRMDSLISETRKARKLILAHADSRGKHTAQVCFLMFLRPHKRPQTSQSCHAHTF